MVFESRAELVFGAALCRREERSNSAAMVLNGFGGESASDSGSMGMVGGWLESASPFSGMGSERRWSPGGLHGINVSSKYMSELETILLSPGNHMLKAPGWVVDLPMCMPRIAVLSIVLFFLKALGTTAKAWHPNGHILMILGFSPVRAS